MKRILTIILMLVCTPLIWAQSISVSSFRLLENDLDANTAGTMERDQNGEVAAIIKVVTTQTGFAFDGGALGVVKTIQKPGEIWLYVPRGLKKITISHPQLGVLRDYYLPMAVASARTYEMVLVTGTIETTVRQARTSQYVVFQLTPPNAFVELDGETLQTDGGMATKMMKFGTYNYRVQAPNYLPEAGNVTVNDPKNKHVVNVALKPNFASVTLTTENEAEIWVNGERKGIGSWTGNLGAGTYEFETRKQNHRSVSITRDIIASIEPQTITLQAPTEAVTSGGSPSAGAIETITVDNVSFNMIKIDGGTFMMGATSEQGGDAYDDEKPVHLVTLSPYYIGETEVTQALWETVMGSNPSPSNFKGRNLPIVHVSWNDCQEFILKLNKKIGRKFRLPTEAEWEFAARGGNKSQGYIYSGSNNLDDVGWCISNSVFLAHNVKTKQANELGIYDMSGSSSEWVQDYWENGYPSSAQTNPTGPLSGSNRVIRGGSCSHFAIDCRVTTRGSNSPVFCSDDLGLRLALD